MTSVSNPPFRLTLHFANGMERDFPIYLDAAKATIERAAFWRPSPVNPTILEHLDEREALLAGTVLVYGGMLASGTGNLGMVDDEGRQWDIPARNVVALSVLDPEAKDHKEQRPVGFRFPPDTGE
jgi:hypothetical protein